MLVWPTGYTSIGNIDFQQSEERPPITARVSSHWDSRSLAQCQACDGYLINIAERRVLLPRQFCPGRAHLDTQIVSIDKASAYRSLTITDMGKPNLANMGSDNKFVLLHYS